MYCMRFKILAQNTRINFDIDKGLKGTDWRYSAIYRRRGVKKQKIRR